MLKKEKSEKNQLWFILRNSILKKLNKRKVINKFAKEENKNNNNKQRIMNIINKNKKKQF